MGGRGASSGRTGASRSTAASRNVAETNTTRAATPVASTATQARTTSAASKANQRPPFKREALIREYEENKARYKGLIADLERKMARTRNMSKWEELLDQKEEYEELLYITERDFQGWKKRGWV